MATIPTRHSRRQHVLDALQTQNADLPEDARRRKYAAMAESPYRFLRGSNHLFWRDIYRDWRFSLYGGVPETACWLQGDAHVYNFGAFGDHAGHVLYGMDDFDDSLVVESQQVVPG